MKIALAQFNPTVGDFRAIPQNPGIDTLRRAARRRFRGILGAMLMRLPAVGSARTSWVLARNERAAAVATRPTLPSIVGYAGRAPEPSGKSTSNAAAELADGRDNLSSIQDAPNVRRIRRIPLLPAGGRNAISTRQSSASRSAKTSGTTKSSGLNRCTNAIPSRNWSKGR